MADVKRKNNNALEPATAPMIQAKYITSIWSKQFNINSYNFQSRSTFSYPRWRTPILSLGGQIQYMNWTSDKLRHELAVKGFVTAPSFPVTILRKLYVDNVLSTENSSNSTVQPADDEASIDGQTIDESSGNDGSNTTTSPSEEVTRTRYSMNQNRSRTYVSSSGEQTRNPYAAHQYYVNKYGGQFQQHVAVLPQTVTGLQTNMNLLSTALLTITKEKETTECQRFADGRDSSSNRRFCNFWCFSQSSTPT